MKARRKTPKRLKKKTRNYLKNQEICADFELETHFWALQSTVVSIFEGYVFNVTTNKKFLKNKLQAEKLGYLDKNMAKNRYVCAILLEIFFKVQKLYTCDIKNI